MKHLFLIIIAMLLFSCSNTTTKVENSNRETTVQIQQLAAIDSITYKVVELDNVVYVLKDNLVVKEVTNQSGAVYSLVLTVAILLLFLLILFAVINAD